MTFDKLAIGDVFYIDGAPYQAYRIYSRIVSCLHLSPDMQHIPHPGGEFGLMTTMFCDLRVNANNASAAECANYLQTLIDLNSYENIELPRAITSPARSRYSRY